MIDVKLATADCRGDWDAYVRKHPSATPYHLPAWTDAVEAAYGHKGYCVTARENGRIVGILPLILIRDPLQRSAQLVSLPFCDLGGCLSDDSTIEPKMMTAALDLAKQIGAETIELRECGDDPESECRTVGDHAGIKYRMTMPLPASSSELWDGFKSKLRSQIRKAGKNGLTHSLGRNPDFISGFYEVFSINMRNLGSPVHSQQLFEAIARDYEQDMLVALVRMKNRTIAAGLVLFLDRIAIIPWASTIPEYNKYAPNMLLYWSVLEHATDRGCRLFDFGRSTFNEGTYKFKQQWGAEPTQLIWKTCSRSGDELIMRGGKSRLRPLVEKLWCKLPLPLANLLGPRLRKYISL